MDLFYWLGLNFSAAAQTYGLGVVILAILSPFLAGGALFAISVVASGRR